MKNPITEKKKRIWPELLSVLVLLSVMAAVRIYFLQRETVIGAGFYEMARVEPRCESVYLEYGAGDLYLRLLRLVFWLFGNQPMFGAYLQCALQMSALLLFYCALRKLAGWIPALAAGTAFLFFPQFLHPLAILNQSQLLFLAWCLNLFLTACVLRNGGLGQERAQSRAAGYLLCFAAGIAGGFGFSLEKLLGIALLPGIFLLPAQKGGSGWKRCLAHLAGIAAGAVLSLAAKAVIFGLGFRGVWAEYRRVQLEGPLLYAGGFLNYMPELLTLLIFLAAAIYFTISGYAGKEAQDTAGIEKQHRKDVDAVQAAEEKGDGTPEAVIKDGEPEAEERKPKINYIENPLPLPKPHVKKSMDYAFDPEPSRMKYDIETDLDDDYDIQ